MASSSTKPPTDMAQQRRRTDDDPSDRIQQSGAESSARRDQVSSREGLVFAFHSCMSGMPWGGSEELWHQAATRLQAEGHQILVNYQWWPETAKKLIELQAGGAKVTFRNEPASANRGGFRGWLQSLRDKNAPSFWLKNNRPDVVLITAAYHTDPIPFVAYCQRLKIPYAINLQSASSSVFLNDRRYEQFREAYLNAERVFFVSQENREKIEMNIAAKLENAEIIENPYNVSRDVPPSWPQDNSTFHLACAGRIHFVSKGQDLIVSVLRQEKWRNRPIKVHIFGSDQGNEQQLRDLVRLYHLEDKIEFAGYSNNIQSVWRDHHALLLPSRYEGAALAIVEAMMCHRIAITTDTGRNRELIDDNESGFVARAPSVTELDDALERAWNRRDEWEAMGKLAGARIRERVSVDPVEDYKQRLLSLARSNASTAHKD